VPAVAESTVVQPVSVPAVAESTVVQPVSVPAVAESTVVQPVSVPAVAESTVVQPVSVPAVAESTVVQPVPDVPASESDPMCESESESQPVSKPTPFKDTPFKYHAKWDRKLQSARDPVAEEDVKSMSFVFPQGFNLSPEEIAWYRVVLTLPEPGCDREMAELVPDKSPPPAFVWPQSVAEKKHKYTEAEKEEDARNLIAFNTRPAEMKDKDGFQQWKPSKAKKKQREGRPHKPSPAPALTSRWRDFMSQEVRDIYTNLECDV